MLLLNFVEAVRTDRTPLLIATVSAWSSKRSSTG